MQFISPLNQGERGRTPHFIHGEYASCGKQHGCCRIWVLISFNFIGWNMGLLMAPASQFIGNIWGQYNDFLLLGDEDVHHAAGLTDYNGGVEEDKLGWGLRWFLWPVHKPLVRLFAHLCQSAFTGLMRKPAVYATKVNTAGKHDRLKHGTCLYWDLFSQRRQQVARGSLCVCGLWAWREMCKDKDFTHVSLF